MIQHFKLINFNIRKVIYFKTEKEFDEKAKFINTKSILT